MIGAGCLWPRTIGVPGAQAARARGAGPVSEKVFRLLRRFHGPALDEIYDRVVADEAGRRILTRGRSLQLTLLDFDRLRALPDGTLGWEYVRFMETNQIDIVAFAEASLRYMAREDYANDEASTLVNRARDIHELVHLVSGYGTDDLGEMCELAFFIREDPPPGTSRLAIRINMAAFRRRGYRHSEAAIAQAFQRGARAGLPLAADWEGMTSEPLSSVRRSLGISEPPPYDPIPRALRRRD